MAKPPLGAAGCCPGEEGRGGGRRSRIRTDATSRPSRRSRQTPHLLRHGLKHLEEIKFCKCIYIEDACLQRISETPNLQNSLLRLFLISCGNVTDKGIIALHKLSNLEYLFLSDLPGIREKERTVQSLKKSMPALELELDLK